MYYSDGSMQSLFSCEFVKYFICGCEVTFSHKHIHIFVESNKTQNGRQSEQRQTIQT
jgi:hypothetical protein